MSLNKNIIKKMSLFYEDIFGSKIVHRGENISYSVSGINNSSFNFAFVSDILSTQELIKMNKDWPGPITIITNSYNDRYNSKIFEMFGFKRYSSFPFLYKKIESKDLMWQKEKISEIENIEIVKVKNKKHLKDFSDISEKVYGIEASMMISSMNKEILNSKKTDIFVGYYNELPIATVTSLHDNESSFIWNMAIVPEFQKNGFMKKMGSVFFHHNYEKGILETYTYTTAKESETLFKSFGSEEIDKVFLWIR